jgi:hypothetical protein
MRYSHRSAPSTEVLELYQWNRQCWMNLKLESSRQAINRVVGLSM